MTRTKLPIYSVYLSDKETKKRKKKHCKKNDDKEVKEEESLN